MVRVTGFDLMFRRSLYIIGLWRVRSPISNHNNAIALYNRVSKSAIASPL
ncbi:hypothetical protein [Tolypothrix sp. NIES-4075]|nr:hypothetical protein [Tolypothrix sp. NIES-4075]